MRKTQITLVPLKDEDREQFIKDNQWAFKYGATEEFGRRDDHFEEEGEIISREMERSLTLPRLVSEAKVDGVIVLGNFNSDYMDLHKTYPHYSDDTLYQ